MLARPNTVIGPMLSGRPGKVCKSLMYRLNLLRVSSDDLRVSSGWDIIGPRVRIRIRVRRVRFRIRGRWRGRWLNGSLGIPSTHAAYP